MMNSQALYGSSVRIPRMTTLPNSSPHHLLLPNSSSSSQQRSSSKDPSRSLLSNPSKNFLCSLHPPVHHRKARNDQGSPEDDFPLYKNNSSLLFYNHDPLPEQPQTAPPIAPSKAPPSLKRSTSLRSGPAGQQTIVRPLSSLFLQGGSSRVPDTPPSSARYLSGRRQAATHSSYCPRRSVSATGLRSNGYQQDTLTSIRRSRERGTANSLRETSDFSSSTSTLNSGKYFNAHEAHIDAHFQFFEAQKLLFIGDQSVGGRYLCRTWFFLSHFTVRNLSRTPSVRRSTRGRPAGQGASVRSYSANNHYRMGNSISGHATNGHQPPSGSHYSQAAAASVAATGQMRDIEQLDEDLEESFNNNLPPSQFKFENEKNNNNPSSSSNLGSSNRSSNKKTHQDDMYRLTNFHRFGSFHVNHPTSSTNNSNGVQSCVAATRQQQPEGGKGNHHTSLLRSMSFRNNIGGATTTSGGASAAKSYKTEATFQPVQPRRISNASVGISSIIFGDENQENSTSAKDRRPSGSGHTDRQRVANLNSKPEKPWSGTLKPVRKPSNASSHYRGNGAAAAAPPPPSTPQQSQNYVNSLAYQILPNHVVAGQAKNQDSYKPVNSTGSSVNFSSQSSSSSPNQRSAMNTSNSGSASSLLAGQLHSNSCALLANAAAAASSPTVVKKRMPVADDADGHLAYLPGDIIMDRYEVVSTLGEGTFGKVAKAKDMTTNNYVALKIIKNIHKVSVVMNQKALDMHTTTFFRSSRFVGFVLIS